KKSIDVVVSSILEILSIQKLPGHLLSPRQRKAREHLRKRGCLMHIEQLKLKNYRNYQQLDIEFDHKVNVIIGENAQGKTNLMEAIYVLSFTKSHRTSREKELIRWDEEF